MANNIIPLFCMTSKNGISVVYGHAMPCAPTLLKEQHHVTVYGINVPTKARFAGSSVPVPGGGPPTLCE